MTVYYADPAAEQNVPIKSRTEGGAHILARDIERLPGTVEDDIGDSRGFLETLASAVSAGRVAVDVTGTLSGYLQTLSNSITASRMQADVASLPGTVAADIATLAGAIASASMKVVLQAGSATIGKLAANVGVNIGTVDALLAQLPAVLGQTNKAGSVSVALASDQGTLAVSAAALPLPSGAAQEHATAASPHSARLSDGTSFYDAAKTGQLPAALVGSRLDTNNGAWLGSTAPTVGLKAVASSIPVGLASDQIPNTLAQAWFCKPTDGTNTAAVKAASTSPAATDPALVVSLSPNSLPPADSISSGTISALDGAVTVSMAGRQYVGCIITGTATYVGTLVAEYTTTNLAPWTATNFITTQSGALATSITPSVSSFIRAIDVPPGATSVRVRSNAYTSGSVVVWMSVTNSGTPPLPPGTSTIGSVKLTDGTTTPNVKAASTAAVAADPALVVALSPNNNTLANALLSKVTDGTNTAAVKAASTAAVAADPAVVVTISPNSALIGPATPYIEQITAIPAVGGTASQFTSQTLTKGMAVRNCSTGGQLLYLTKSATTPTATNGIVLAPGEWSPMLECTNANAWKMLCSSASGAACYSGS